MRNVLGSALLSVRRGDRFVNVLLEKLAGLAKVLNVTVDYLLGGDPTENLEAAEDKAFFREYEAMTPEARARLRRLAKALDN